MSLPDKLGIAAALVAVRRAKRLWLLHAGANVALAALVYGWLWVPEARGWQLLLSALLALVIAAAALWLHGATAWYFHAYHSGGEATLRAAFRGVLPRLPALFAWFAGLALVLWATGWLLEAAGEWSKVVASWLTLKLEKPVSPESVLRLFRRAAWALDWVVVPLAFAPVFVRTALAGFAALRPGSVLRAWRAFGRLGAWVAVGVALLTGYYLPGLLAGWVPEVTGLAAETASAAARLLLAYALAVTAWLLLLSWFARPAAAGGEAPGDSASVRQQVKDAPLARSSAAAAERGE